MTDVSRAREHLTRIKGLTDTERSEVLELYTQAAQSLQQQIRWNAQQVGFARTKLLLDSELTAARSAANQPLSSPPPAPVSETAQQVDEEITRLRNDHASRIKLRDDLAKLQASLTKRDDAIASRRSEIEQILQSIKDEISVLALASASPTWEQARRMALQARQQSLNQELLALVVERDASQVRQKLISVQRDSYLLKLDADDRYVTELEARKYTARVRDAKKSLENATSQAQNLASGFPQLSALAEEIRSRATDLWGQNGVEARSDLASVQIREMRASKLRFDQITVSTVSRYENSGWLSPATDWWPARVEKFGKLSEVAVLAISYRAAETLARRDLFRLEDETKSAVAFETEVQQLLDASEKRTGNAGSPEFRTRARSIVQLKRSVTAELLNNERLAVNRFGEAFAAAQELLITMRGLQSFVMKHVLWARSVSGPFLPSPAGCLQALLWFFSYGEWSQIASGFTSQAGFGIAWLAGLALILAVFPFRSRLADAFRTRLREDDPRKIRDLFRRLVLTLIWVLPGPLALVYAGWAFGTAGAGVNLAEAIAGGAPRAAGFLFLALLTRRLLANGPAGDGLMNWPQPAREVLDPALRRLIIVFTPLWFIASALAQSGMSFYNDPLLQAHNNSLGRLCFLTAVLSFLFAGVSVLRSKRTIAAALGTGFKGSLYSRAGIARWLLFLVLVSAFLLALAGFYITAFVLMQEALRTAGLTLALMLLHFLLRAWRLKQTSALAAESPETEIQTQQADLQMRRLTRFGLTLVWIVGGVLIWSPTLPSLSLLGRVQLLPQFKVESDRPSDVSKLAAASAVKEVSSAGKQDPAQPMPAPVPAASTESGKTAAPAPREPLYLSHVLFAFLVGVLISMLVGNIPGLLHFTVFRRLTLDVGGKYAVTTVTRYVVIVIGVFVISALLGVNWSKIQWLAAALTFGIGFGLQEIFANFAAGMILLFDRSIRVGDVVSLGNLSGVVARIQMRATTVTLWDRSDMVVPNKEFITSKLVNWTLSNPDTRVDLRVGVDYTSDVEKVREVLLRVAREHTAVLRVPAPQVLLVEFGASAITFQLQVFTMYAYGRGVLLDELHRAVVKEFRMENIVMPLPQLDVHHHSTSASSAGS